MMTLEQEHSDALGAAFRASDDVAAWGLALQYAWRRWPSPYTIAEARTGLALARTNRAECEAKVRAAERALIEAGEVVP